MATDNPHNGNGTADSPFESARKAFNDTAASFTSQAEAKARDYAAEGKDRAVEALDGVAGLVGDAAAQVSERLGDQYGGYVQQAADAVSGFANTLREKDADELVDEARNVVRSSPAIAIAAAAAVGFLLARVVKSGFAPKADNDEPVVPAPAKPSTARKAAPKKPAAPKAAAPKAAVKPAAKKPAKSAAPEAPLVDTPIADTPAPDSPPAV